MLTFITAYVFILLWRTLVGEIRYPVRLSTERIPANANCCFRNKFILVVTYGKVPCFYFLEKALSLH